MSAIDFSEIDGSQGDLSQLAHKIFDQPTSNGLEMDSSIDYSFDTSSFVDWRDISPSQTIITSTQPPPLTATFCTTSDPEIPRKKRKTRVTKTRNSSKKCDFCLMDNWRRGSVCSNCISDVIKLM
jgi:hypothetical protein